MFLRASGVDFGVVWAPVGGPLGSAGEPFRIFGVGRSVQKKDGKRELQVIPERPGTWGGPALRTNIPQPLGRTGRQGPGDTPLAPQGHGGGYIYRCIGTASSPPSTSTARTAKLEKRLPT